MSYKIVNGTVKSEAPSNWYTNLHHFKKDNYLELTKRYTPEKYPKYDNYDAIEVSKVVDIPTDYTGLMGVPITFIGDHNPKQFDIVDTTKGSSNNLLTLNNTVIYARWIIKHRV